MPVISLVSSKGGVGKSTIALVLVGEILHAGGTVTVIDADPNQPIADWAETTGERKGLTVVGGVTEKNIIEEIEVAATKTAFVIIDLEGSANTSVGYAISRSDLVIIPSQGSILDRDGAGRALDLISETNRAFKVNVDHAILLTRTNAAVRPRPLRQVIDDFSQAGVSMFTVQLFERMAFSSIFSYGGTLHDLRDSEASNLEGAKENAAALLQEILTRMKLKNLNDRSAA